MKDNPFFIAEDFLPDLDQNREAWANLPVEYRHSFSFRIGSSTTLDMYKVSHDLEHCTGCDCIGNAQYHRRCQHMKRGDVVLRRRKERLSEAKVQPQVETTIPDVVLSTSKGEAPLMSNRPGGFSIFR